MNLEEIERMAEAMAESLPDNEADYQREKDL